MYDVWYVQSKAERSEGSVPSKWQSTQKLLSWSCTSSSENVTFNCVMSTGQQTPSSTTSHGWSPFCTCWGSPLTPTWRAMSWQSDMAWPRACCIRCTSPSTTRRRPTSLVLPWRPSVQQPQPSSMPLRVGSIKRWGFWPSGKTGKQRDLGSVCLGSPCLLQEVWFTV